MKRKKRSYKQVGKSSIRVDRRLKAKKVGWRTISGKKRKYFENRRNRSDKDRRKRI